jgi:hypothetical protein
VTRSRPWIGARRRLSVASAVETLLTLAAGLAASIPVIAATVDAIRAHWVPVADRGIIATRAHDVFTSHTPLVGQYTLAGEVTGHVTHSLGPMLFWLLSIPAYHGSTVGMTLTMGAVNTLSIVGCVVLARLRGGRGLMLLTALAIALMCQSLAAETFHDIWNPSAALLPFMLLIFLCWSLACGSYRLVPLALLVASFVVQAHLTYLPPTLALPAASAGVDAREPAGRGRLLERDAGRAVHRTPGQPDVGARERDQAQGDARDRGRLARGRRCGRCPAVVAADARESLAAQARSPCQAERVRRRLVPRDPGGAHGGLRRGGTAQAS